MGLSQALFAGVSGLIGHQTFLDVIGNNLANVNTVAFKRSVLRFNDLFSQTLSGGTAPAGDIGGINPVQLGLGVRVASVNQDFAQGGIETTSNPADIAIEGRGFFVVAQGESVRFTRDGSFHIGTDGTLQTSEGWRLQGTNADATTGIIPPPSSSTIESVVVPLGTTGGAQATTSVTLAGNLNAGGDVASTGTRAQSVLLFTRTNDGVLSALASSLGGAAYIDVAGLHVAQASRVRPGDRIYVDGAAVTPGLYTVATVNSAADLLTVVETLPGAAANLTVYLPALAADDLNYTEVTSGSATGRLGGVYDEDLNLLLGNASTEQNPYIDLTAMKGDRFITERFRYGDPALPGTSSSEESHGTTLQALADFLEDVLGINAAYDPDADRPEMPHGAVVGRGGDDGVRDLDEFNEARAVFGRSAALGTAETQSVSGTGSLTDGTIAGSRLIASGGAGTFTGLAVGTEIHLAGSGVADAYYRVVDVALDGSYVTLGDPLTLAEDAAGATGTTNVSWQIAPNRLYLCGNLGTLNHISEVRLESGPTDRDIFEDGLLAQADGESVCTSGLVYDSAGGSHALELTAVLVNRTDTEATWRWYAECPDDSTYSEEPNSAPPPAPPLVVTGKRTDRCVGWGDIVFDQNGIFRRAESALDGSERIIDIDLRDQAMDQSLDITPDLSGLTQFVAQQSTLQVAAQDGFPAGVMETFTVGIDGVIRGIYSNGVTQDVAQLALADFANVNGLLKDGENTYIPGVNSGNPVISSPLTQGLGAVRGSSLELSNVELAEEFTDLIIAQRGFQANARVITTSDEMLSELMNMFR